MARQVLPIAGAAIGAYFYGARGAQWGWMAGSLIGNYVDPVVLKAPSVGDLAQQTSQEGVPRPIVFGLSPPMAGNIILTSEPKIVKTSKRQGKGGPKQEENHIYRTYAIGVCRGPITGLLRVWRNGSLVYDARPGGDPSNNANFLKNARFVLGTFDQDQQPDLVAVTGAIDTPFFRGTAYLVMANEDLTDLRGAIPQYAFQVLRCEGTPYVSRPYPIVANDNLLVGARPLNGDAHNVHYAYTLEDAVSVGAAPLAGDLRGQRLQYTIPPESVTVSGAPFAGTLRTLLRSYTIPPEAVDVTAAPFTGAVKRVLITYDNDDADAIDVAATPQSGVLST